MKKLIPFAIAVVLIIVVAVCWVLPEFKGKYTYSTEEVDLYEYYEIYANEEVLVTLQNDLRPERARVFDEKVYVDIKMVETYFTDRFYYNETEQVLLYSTPTDIITVKVGDESTAYYVNDMATTTGYKIAFIKDNTLYVALDYVKRYSDFAYELFESPYRLQIYTQEAEAELADIKKDTQVRTLGKEGVLTERVVVWLGASDAGYGQAKLAITGVSEDRFALAAGAFELEHIARKCEDADKAQDRRAAMGATVGKCGFFWGKFHRDILYSSFSQMGDCFRLSGKAAGKASSRSKGVIGQ